MLGIVMLYNYFKMLRIQQKFVNDKLVIMGINTTEEMRYNTRLWDN